MKRNGGNFGNSIMQRLLLIILLSCFAFAVEAQSNTLKGRIMGIPLGSKLFTMGIGYERIISENTSIQLVFNRYGYDWRATDGGAEFTNSFVPEFRYFLGQKAVNDSWFLGIYSEVIKTRIEEGGERPPGNRFLKGTRRTFNPGILIGKNISFSDRWGIEFFIGGKYIFADEAKEYIINGSHELRQKFPNRLGVRAGVNVCYFW